jgi:nucleotidyltransferase/DNA polymerase involved in DNA repair
LILKKSAGLTVVKPAGTQDFLAPLQVREVPGSGRKAKLALFELGIMTVGDLVAYEVRKLVAEFGRGLLPCK